MEKYLKEQGTVLKQNNTSSLFPDYRPEFNQSSDLLSKEAAYYQSLISILKWASKLGRVDICYEVLMISSNLAIPKYKHIKQLFDIFSYLKCHHNDQMVFDLQCPNLKYAKFEKGDWS